MALARTPSWQVIDTVSEPAERIRREFGILPGLSLTFGQARRLWALHEGACRELLAALVAEGFLRVRADSRYVLRQARGTTA